MNRATECNHFLDDSKTCVKLPLSKRPQIGFQDQLWLNAGTALFVIIEKAAKFSFVVCCKL